jgi:hypothetical protein
MNFDYLYRRLTSKYRMLPDFHISGSQKCGTTSLAYYLDQHPDVVISKPKEVHFFNQMATHDIMDYRLYFPTKLVTLFRPKLLSGEATPDYMIYPQYAKLAKKYMPDLKVVVLLKNPVSRAISHYKHNLMMKREWLSFEEALAIEGQRTNLEYVDLLESKKDAIKNYSNYAYKRKGVYFEQVKWLFDEFGENNVKVVQSEMFFKRPVEVLNEILSFLEISEMKGKIDTEPKNVAQVQYEVDEHIKDELKLYFTPNNEKLFALLGKEFNWS